MCDEPSATGGPGRCGDDLTWEYCGNDHTLTVRGTGDMYDYHTTCAPWTGFSGEIENVVLPKGLTHIGNSAFSGAASLKSVSIPETVISMGDRAFGGCGSLTSLNIPRSVNSIGTDAFAGCPLEHIRNCSDVDIGPGLCGLSEDAAAVVENIAYEEDSGKCGTYLEWRFSERSQSLTFIGSGAMKEYDPDPAPWAKYSENVRTVVLPDGLTNISRRAFDGFGGLESIAIPGTVGSIGERAFKDCGTLVSVSIPRSVTWISPTAFEGCSNLEEMAVDPGNGVYRSEVGILFDKEKTKLVLCPMGIRSTDATVPYSVTEIGEGAFCGCGLTSVNMPNSLEMIGDRAFSGCGSLTSLNIPRSVKSIGTDAFAGCPLEHIRNYSDVNIGPGLYGLSEDTAAVIEKITYKMDSGGCGADLEWRYSERSQSLTFIGSGSMNEEWDPGCAPWSQYSESVRTIILPDGLTAIDYHIFDGFGKVESITIPGTVRTIYEGAFKDCKMLGSVSIPRSVTWISPTAFDGCSNLKEISVDPGNGAYWSEGGMVFNKEKTTLLHCPRGMTGAVTIPGSVEKIDVCAFFGCSKLASVTIPCSVTTIGPSAFEGCSSLTRISIPELVHMIGGYTFADCSGLTSVSFYCSSVTIHYAAFWNCSSIETVHCYTALSINPVQCGMPNGVKTVSHICGEHLLWDFDEDLHTLTVVGSGAMNDWNDEKEAPWKDYRGLIAKVELPSGLTHIGNYAFAGFALLDSVVVPENTESVGTGTFSGCSSLASVSLPDGLKTIGREAFSGCALTYLSLPGSLVSIGDDAFGSCPVKTVDNHSGLEIVPESYGLPGDVTVNGYGPENAARSGRLLKPPYRLRAVRSFLCQNTGRTVPFRANFITSPAVAMSDRSDIRARYLNAMRTERPTAAPSQLCWALAVAAARRRRR